MGNWTIFHNPKCGKSRQTLQLLQEHGIRPEVVEYLKNPPSAEELAEIAKKLGLKPSEFVRAKEEAFQKLKLKDAGEKRLLEAMAENPVLIERPIVIKGKKAVLGRPPENALELIND